MKFRIEGKLLNEAVEKSLLVCGKSPDVLPELVSITIKADERGRVHILTTDLVQALDIVLEADVSECGKIMVRRNDICKIGKLDGEVVVSAANDIFSVFNGKKRRDVKAFVGDEIDLPSMLPEECLVFSCSRNELARMIADLNPLRSTDATNAVYTGFFFDVPHRRIAACNGFAVGMHDLAGEYNETGRGFVVPYQFTDFARKMLKDKGSGTVCVHYGKPAAGGYIAQFSADNWVYTIRPIEGLYLDLDKVMERNSTGVSNDVVVNAKELYDIACDYEKNRDEKKAGMHWILDENNRLYTAIISKDYHSADCIALQEGSGEYKHDAHINIDCAFEKRLLSLFVRHRIRIEFGSEHSMIRLSDEDDPEDGYLGYIMPLRPKPEIYESVLSMVNALRTYAG